MKPLDKKAKEHVNDLTPLLDVSFMDKEECVNYQAELSYKAGYLEGRQDALIECIVICKEKIARALEDLKESKVYGTNTVGYGMDLGAHDSAFGISNEIENLMHQESGNE